MELHHSYSTVMSCEITAEIVSSSNKMKVLSVFEG